MVKQYAILNSEGVCVNRVLWDGLSDWQPPDGCSVVLDEDGLYPIPAAAAENIPAEDAKEQVTDPEAV